MYALLLSIPLVTGTLTVVIFMQSFYGIKHNQYGVKDHNKYFPILENKSATDLKEPISEKLFRHKHNAEIIGWPEDKNKCRKVLISTLEYEIIDWKVKVKIDGLGVMSSLMGKAMTDVDLIWVVPKVKDVEYLASNPAEPIEVIIFGGPLRDSNSGNVVLSGITEFMSEFHTVINGNTNNLSLNELSGGVRISFIFHSVSPNAWKAYGSDALPMTPYLEAQITWLSYDALRCAVYLTSTL